MVVENRVLMNVVFPNPDSPATYGCQSHPYARAVAIALTIIVKAAPRLATILCLVGLRQYSLHPVALW